MPEVSIESKKAWLSRGIRIKAELQLLNDTRRCVYEDATHITGKISMVNVKGACNVHRFDKLAEIDAFIEQKEKELCSMRAEIIKAIYTVPSISGRSVLLCKYIHGLTVDATADRLSYSARHVQRMTAEAVKQIDIKLYESA